MNTAKVNSAVKIELSIQRLEAKLPKLLADRERLVKSMTFEERSEFAKRTL